MHDFKRGCQTITWGENQRERLAEVFDEVKAAGYDGVEVGFRHIKDTDPATLTTLLSDRGLSLAASHIGGNLEDTGQAEGERRVLDEVLDYLTAARCGLLMYSGLRFQDPGQFQRDLDSLSRAAVECQKRGVQLLYHNHDWEFADGARVMNALRANTDPALGFCPDVGWVHRGGADVLPFLDTIKDRIGAVHFKDFAAPGSAATFVMLGQGVVPFPEVAAWLRANLSGRGLWVIAEQDRADVPPAEAAATNGAYLQAVLSGEVSHA